ncbi:hypothetical protein FXF51_09065 [Nonomuraea sp. PA05]|uniref:NucA/NucB deoxyribonuclease domain-containing protein n=1 Tax=Nonomuraea sp. PA05 TaxID=2604466 RepID=UPI0011D62D53|nr:hypothetical protein [Nonomuraea sp. PA05]TYB69357.1 hypothetical protein FXF51_09065 [Nonomuraea sp. PA05]
MKRIFSMKESRDTNFTEVITHIKEARNQATNKGTFPPLRDGANYSDPLNPPLKGPLGNVKAKVMRGDWLASRDVEAGKPFTKATEDQELKNRKVFSLNPKDYPPSGLFQAEGKWYTNSWCKYYWEEVYRAAPRPTSRTVNCDEFPWASTTQGAASAKGHFSIKAISGTQNQSHGGTVGNWTNTQRLLAGDSFWYEIIP